MAKTKEVRENEVAFCGEVKSWLDALFSGRGDWPFSRAKIEQYGVGSRRRSDLRVFRRGSDTPVLAGEVKLPGTPEGASPYNSLLLEDAFIKADNIQAPYFFTWNVNTFVLFDRSKWNAPMIERRVKEWKLGLELKSPEDCSRPEVQARLRDRLLPEIFEEFAAIVDGRIVEWGMPPDDIFIRSLESHLELPIGAARDHLILTSDQDSVFRSRLQSWMAAEMNWTFDPESSDNWRETLDRAARTLCYVFCNRAIFYEAIRAKYPSHLIELKMPHRGRHGHGGIYDYFRQQFQRAVFESGDYEPVFYPQVDDWAGALIFASETACDGWNSVFANLAQYDFRQIPYDIIGGIFQKLISPEERQKFGQFYTNEDIIDVINAFCIHRAGDIVIDPACGSGSFLVRAYHRKAWLSEHAGGGRRHQDYRKEHFELLREIYGCDIALFAAHLATLNLAARHIDEQDNYPYIARANFFEVAEQRNRFTHVPGMHTPDGGRERLPVRLSDVDAVIGNPPYVRQEHIPRRSELKLQNGETKEAHEARLKTAKEHLQDLCKRFWPALRLSGRSDLHCYFWPVAASLLKPNGFFGFLTSSSWLDVEYGFALQGWILKHFKLIAVMESLDEPWFQDARVKTAVTILQRCNGETDRMKNVVRFVRFLKPLREILGDRPHGDEAARQRAAKSLRQRILRTNENYSDGQLRIIAVRQSQLWDEGVRAGNLLREGLYEPDNDETEQSNAEEVREAAAMYRIRSDYVAGKWGRFLRAPDFYFRLIHDYRERFVRLGEVAEVKFGIKSGCDAFFMPRDVTREVLNQVKNGLPWNDVGVMTPCKRSEVESGKVRIIRAGDNTIHPVETEYLRPEVHSLMDVERPVIRAKELDRVVLWVDKPLSALRNTYVGKYIRWGAKQTFASRKSKSVPVPQRSTCASRPLWYDLTNVDTGTVFWPMAQKYRHIAPTNPDDLVCNHNLFYVRTPGLTRVEAVAFAAILNSTIVALFKHFYGRYAGSEGTLKTEVVDTVLLEIPDPRGVSAALAERLSRAMKKISKRTVTHLVEEALLQCHTEEGMREILCRPPDLPRELCQEDRRELDDCVLELIGVTSKRKREQLLQELYAETVRYYRYQRTQDIQSMENRAGGKSRRLTPHDLAESIWRSLPESRQGPPLVDWMKASFRNTRVVEIPEGRPQPLGAGDMFSPTAVIFRGDRETHEIIYASTEHAELASELARLGIRGQIAVPQTPADCSDCLKQIDERVTAAQQYLADETALRTGISSLQEKTVALLMQWYIQD